MSFSFHAFASFAGVCHRRRHRISCVWSVDGIIRSGPAAAVVVAAVGSCCTSHRICIIWIFCPAGIPFSDAINHPERDNLHAFAFVPLLPHDNQQPAASQQQQAGPVLLQWSERSAMLARRKEATYLRVLSAGSVHRIW